MAIRRLHIPLWVGTLARPTANTFAVLFACEAATRALTITLIPIQGGQLLGDAQAVSLAFLAAYSISLVAALVMPMVVHIIRRRWALSAGAVLYVVAQVSFASGSAPGFLVGLAAAGVAGATLEITLNLYVLDNVPREDLKRFEPTRLFLSGLIFCAGPWLGVRLANDFGTVLPFALAGICAITLLGYFWFLRLTENPALNTPLKPPPNPIRFLPRFVAQPRLVLAWALAFARCGWWIMFFVYAPLYAIEQGFSSETAALVVSVGTAGMFCTPLWARIGGRIGLRRLLIVGYGFGGALTLATAASAIVGFEAGVGVVLLVAAAIATTLIDGAGNVPFLRSVHPYERAEMTAVFTTYRQSSQLVVPGIFAVVLVVMPLSSAFAIGGGVLVVSSWLSRYIPKRL